MDELQVRGKQALAIFAERHGWSRLTKLPSDHSFGGMLDPLRTGSPLNSKQEVFEYFQRRADPQFFSAFNDRELTIGAFRARWPLGAEKIIELANRTIAGSFDLLGFEDLRFGEPIDWHFEPVENKRSPLIHWSLFEELNADLSGDKKIVWELNRHQHFVQLGQAYWFTNNERYAQTLVAHLESWMDQNPPKLGLNWVSSLEIAFRSISWLWAFHFLKGSQALTSQVFVRILKFLYLNARHLETYLSTYSSPNTHLTGEALGLFYLGTLLPEFLESGRWRDTGREILLKWLPLQVNPDGVYFEQSSYYHRYTTDFYTHFLVLSELNGEVLPAEVRSKLQGLMDHLMYITRPDGTSPLIGDDDGGRLTILERDSAANDFRSSLSTGAVLFDRKDYKFVAGEVSPETLWLLGPAGLGRFDSIQAREPASKSIGFSSAGYYVMRDSWTREANYLLFDCGPHGTANCGHAHADTLSFELAAKGRTLIVDPGTYTYTGSKEIRDWFRGSTGHNSLTIDGQSSSIPKGPFSWKTIANGQCLKWISQDRFDFVEGKHDGYMRLSLPVDHLRSILFLKDDCWIIRDQVKSSGKHSAELWFHFDSDATPLIEALDSTLALCEHNGKAGVKIFVFADNGQWRKEDGWVSHCYGDKERARLPVFSATIESDAEIVTFIFPQAEVNMTKARVREVEAIGGKAFEVRHDDGVDIVMVRTEQSGRVEMERLASDFAWTWARFPNLQDKTPSELVLLAGTTVELEGKQILKWNRPVDYLVIKRLSEAFRVESSQAVFDCQLPIANSDSMVSDFKPTI